MFVDIFDKYSDNLGGTETDFWKVISINLDASSIKT